MTGHEHAGKSQAILRHQETGFSERARKGRGKIPTERSIAKDNHNVKTNLGNASWLIPLGFLEKLALLRENRGIISE
jgi:hypothetical protein